MVNIVKYLKKYKFKATIMTHEDHKNLVKKNNINFISFNTNYEYEKNNIFKFKEFKDTSSNFLSLLSDYQHPFTNLSYLVKSKIMSAPTLKNISNNIAYHFINIVDNFDMVIASNTLDIVPSLTEKYKIPLINIMHFPWFYETTCFPHPLVCCRDSLNFPFNHISNLNSWKYMNKLLWLGYSQKDNRKKLGLEPIKNFKEWIEKNQKIPQIFTVSKHFLGDIKEWDNYNILMSGFVFSKNKSINVPKKILNLKEKNKKIIYIGFGSAKISYNFSLRLFKLITNYTDYIFVLQGMIADYYKESEIKSSNIVLIKSFPHDILFKYVDLTVISGGIGTIMMSLFLKKPVIIMPITVDHFFNGYIVEKKKLGSYLLKKDSSILIKEIDFLLNDQETKINVDKYSENIKKDKPFENIKKFINLNKKN